MVSFNAIERRRDGSCMRMIHKETGLEVETTALEERRILFRRWQEPIYGPHGEENLAVIETFSYSADDLITAAKVLEDWDARPSAIDFTYEEMILLAHLSPAPYTSSADLQMIMDIRKRMSERLLELTRKRISL